MTSWVGRRYAIALIDDELRKLARDKLDTAPADPRRPRILHRIDALLDMRLEESRRGDEQPG